MSGHWPPRRGRIAALPLVGALLFVGTPAAATSAASHARATCPFPHAKVVRASSLARVFRAGEFLAGCSRDHKIKTIAHEGSLEDGMGSEDYAHVRVAGTWVAFEGTGYFLPITESLVTVVDLRRAGKRVEKGTTGYSNGFRLTAPARIVHLPSNVHVTDLELRNSGTVAWIQSDPATGQLAVRVRTRHATTDLAAGADIDPASLHLKGTRLSWMQAGAEHSARIA